MAYLIEDTSANAIVNNILSLLQHSVSTVITLLSFHLTKNNVNISITEWLTTHELEI